MARAGIYKSEVVRARANLLAQGRNPSVDAIRVELGNTGSKTTIQRYLKEIGEEDGGQPSSKIALSEALQSLTARLAERLQAEADERIVQLKAKHSEELRAAKDTTTAQQDQLQAVSKTLDAARREIDAGKQRHDEMAARCSAEAQARAQAQQQVTDLQIQLQALTGHSESIESKYADARRSLEHFREAAKEQREREARKHESEVQFLQQEIRSLQTALTETQAKFVTAIEDTAKVTTELEALRREIEQVGPMKAELAAASERLAIATTQREELSKQLEAEHRRSDELAAEVVKTIDERQRLDTRVRQIEAELLATRVRQESDEHLRSQIDEQIRVQFGLLLRGKRKSPRA